MKIQMSINFVLSRLCRFRCTCCW